MTTYNWDLIERLLHEVQNGEGSFAPRQYAEQEAAEKATAGESTGNLDALKKTDAKGDKKKTGAKSPTKRKIANRP